MRGTPFTTLQYRVTGPGSNRQLEPRPASGAPGGERRGRGFAVPRQERVQRRHHLGALADRGGDTLHRAAADVADREDARPARLEGMPIAGAGLGAGAYEPIAVERDAALGEPRGVRIGADEEEELRGAAAGLLTAVARAPADRLQPSAGALDAAHLAAQVHHDVRERRDAVDQVARHARLEARAAHEHADLRGLAGEVDHRLAGRVPGAYQRHLGFRAQTRLERRRPVVHAAALELGEVRTPEAAVLGAAGDQHCARAHALLVRQPELEARQRRGRVALEPHDLVRNRDLCAELLGLVVGARHQREAGDPGRKTEVVLDSRGRTRLPAEGTALKHQYREALRGRVDRGRQARRAGADDRDVVAPRCVDALDHAEAAREVALTRIPQKAPVRADDDRQLARLDLETLQKGLRARVLVGIEALAGVHIARKEVLEAQDVGVPGPPDDHRAASAALDQLDAAQDQRAHDALAELRLLD